MRTPVPAVAPRHWPWLAPVAVGAATAAATVTVALVDPNETGHYPTCPFLAMTGWQCPGCGTLRAVHALTRGDLVAAVDLNVLTVAVLPVLLLGWVGWLRFGLGRRARMPDLPPWAAPMLAVVVPVFWLVRNLPFGSALAP